MKDSINPSILCSNGKINKGPAGDLADALGDLPLALEQAELTWRQKQSLWRVALRIGEQVYGQDHPNVAIDVKNLGLVLQDQGDLQGARKCLERALKIFRDKLGEDHPKTKVVANNLNSVG